MTRSVALAALLLFAACGTETDERPATVEFITEAILEPACATAVCHSSFTKEDGYSFGTVEESRKALGRIVEPGDLEQSLLYLTLVSPGGDGAEKQMPRDQPLPNADIALIRTWILDGAEGI